MSSSSKKTIIINGLNYTSKDLVNALVYNNQGILVGISNGKIKLKDSQKYLKLNDSNMTMINEDDISRVLNKSNNESLYNQELKMYRLNKPIKPAPPPGAAPDGARGRRGRKIIGIEPGMGPGIEPGMGPGIEPGMGPGIEPGMGPGIEPGMGPGMEPGMGPESVQKQMPKAKRPARPSSAPPARPAAKVTRAERAANREARIQVQKSLDEDEKLFAPVVPLITKVKAKTKNDIVESMMNIDEIKKKLKRNFDEFNNIDDILAFIKARFTKEDLTRFLLHQVKADLERML